MYYSSQKSSATHINDSEASLFLLNTSHNLPGFFVIACKFGMRKAGSVFWFFNSIENTGIFSGLLSTAENDTLCENIKNPKLNKCSILYIYMTFIMDLIRINEMSKMFHQLF